MLVLPHSFSHGRLDTILHVQRKVVELWAYWSQSVCRGPQGLRYSPGHLFWMAHTFWPSSRCHLQCGSFQTWCSHYHDP
jgi:hypothetical protein